jgi:cbb3-type cytochrome oxidase maturation protein
LNIDLLIYMIGSVAMAGISIGFVLWGFKTGQFKDNEHLKRKPLEEDEEENVS